MPVKTIVLKNYSDTNFENRFPQRTDLRSLNNLDENLLYRSIISKSKIIIYCAKYLNSNLYFSIEFIEQKNTRKSRLKMNGQKFFYCRITFSANQTQVLKY